MTILDRYIFKEHFSSFFFGLFVFLTILLVDLLMELVELIVNKGVPVDDVTKLFFFALPEMLVLVIPMALLVSTLIAFGRLSSDKEIIATLSCGISIMQISKYIILSALIISIGTFYFNETVVPYSNEQRQEIFRKITFKKPLPKIASKMFFDAGSSRTFYVNSTNPETGDLYDVLMYEFIPNAFPRIITASRAVIETDTSEENPQQKALWQFFDGTIYEFSQTGKIMNDIVFKKLNFPVETTYGDYKAHKSKQPRDMNMQELRKTIIEYEKARINTQDLWVELYMKTSLPFASFVFILIGIPLAINNSRGTKSIGIGISIMIIFVYYLLMATGKAVARSNIIPVLPAVWLQNVITGIVGIFLLRRLSKK